MKVCPQCHEKYPDDKKFCGVCGTELVTETPKPQPPAPPMPKPQVPSTPSSTTPEVEKKEEASEKKGCGCIVTALVIGLIILAIRYCTDSAWAAIKSFF